MSVRLYKSEDRDSVIHLHQELQRYEHRFRPSRALGRDVSVQQVAQYEDMLADDDEDAFLYVAEDGGQVIGFVFFLAETEFLEQEAGQMYVQDLMVTEAARRTGVGSALMDAVRAEMARMSIQQIDLQVLVDNDDALSFYRKLGFVPAYIGLKAISSAVAPPLENGGNA